MQIHSSMTFKLYLFILMAFAVLSAPAAIASPGVRAKEGSRTEALKLATTKVALVPFQIQGNQSYENFWLKIIANVDRAIANKANLIVFPELLTADLVDAAEAKESLTVQFRRVAEKFTPKYMTDIQKLALDRKVNIVAGSSPRIVGKNIYNTAIFATAEGRLETQDKVFLTPDEKDWGWASGDKLKVIDTSLGRLAILICYDAEFPQLSHDLAPLNPEIMIVPSMTDTIEGFRRVRWTAQARAIEHRAYVVHVGTTGNPDPSWPHWAQASALSPSEKGFPGLLAEGKANESEILMVDLDMKKLREARAKRGIHPSKDQNERKLRLKTTLL
jgi:predicted amidohydrolase